MNRYRISSRKLLKLPSAPTRDSAAVWAIVTTRTEVVARIGRNESIALMRVCDPPYIVMAITEIKPSAEKISTMAPKPLKTLAPAMLMACTASNVSPVLMAAASTVPRHISQMAPSAEPQ